MKITLGLFFIVFLLGCQKEKFISEEYQKLIGEWKNVDGSYSPKIVFKANGKVTCTIAERRGFNFQVLSTSIGKTFSINGKDKTQLLFHSRNKDSAMHSILFYSADLDTIVFYNQEFVKL